MTRAEQYGIAAVATALLVLNLLTVSDGRHVNFSIATSDFGLWIIVILLLSNEKP